MERRAKLYAEVQSGTLSEDEKKEPGILT